MANLYCYSVATDLCNQHLLHNAKQRKKMLPFAQKWARNEYKCKILRRNGCNVNIFKKVCVKTYTYAVDATTTTTAVILCSKSHF